VTSIPKPTRKYKQPKPKVTIKERDLQAMAEDLCLTLGIRFFRIPDKLLGFLSGYAPTWVRVFVARYFAGVPDMMLFKKLPDGRNEVLFLEIKTEAGELSASQKRWHLGLSVIVTHGWEEMRDVITQYAEKP
jgi:predicted Holliday junction resolvase-like endonuclease